MSASMSAENANPDRSSSATNRPSVLSQPDKVSLDDLHELAFDADAEGRTVKESPASEDEE